MATVSNSSPLIYLATLSDLDLLRRLFRDIQIPPAVWTETVEQGAGLPGRESIRHAVTDGWLRVTHLHAPAESIRAAGHLLDWGETEAIRLAEESNADVLLMDDRRAVVHARSLGFLVAPTLAIYIRAKQKGLVQSVRDKADHLRSVGFRLTEPDYQTVLRVAGER